MFQFQTLYKRASSGALLSHTICVDGPYYWSIYGQVDGTQQESAMTECHGKNSGKANATTDTEQAMLEARSLWEKKQKSHGYVTDPDAALAGATSALVTGGVDPMLAHSYAKSGDKLKYPAALQRKYDGHRCLAVVNSEGRCTLWSRTRKPILSMPHIAKAVEALGLADVVLDGELFVHGPEFERLTHLIRQSGPVPGHEQMEYHVYDVVDDAVLQIERTRWLHSLGMQSPLVCVQTVTVQDEDEMMVWFEQFVAEGYEGAIARNLDGLYIGRRSYDLLKIKEFDDTEFVCVGVEEGRGKMAGCAIFVCQTSDGVPFKAKMTGEIANLQRYVTDPSLVVGKQVVVKFQGMTNKNGVPRFPVALRIREEI